MSTITISASLKKTGFSGNEIQIEVAAHESVKSCHLTLGSADLEQGLGGNPFYDGIATKGLWKQVFNAIEHRADNFILAINNQAKIPITRLKVHFHLPTSQSWVAMGLKPFTFQHSDDIGNPLPDPQLRVSLLADATGTKSGYGRVQLTSEVVLDAQKTTKVFLGILDRGPMTGTEPNLGQRVFLQGIEVFLDSGEV